MQRLLRFTVPVFLGCFVGSAPVLAAGAVDAMTLCIANSTTGKDRVELAKWVFVLMAEHPQLQQLSTATPEQQVAGNQKVAQLVTRLITKDCLDETRAAMKVDPAALQKSFQSLGVLAMQEIMSNPAVAASMGSFAQYLDAAAITSALK